MIRPDSDARATSALIWASTTVSIRKDRRARSHQPLEGCVHADGIVHRGAYDADPVVVPMDVHQGLGCGSLGAAR